MDSDIDAGGETLPVTPAPPDRFPMSLAEYAYTTRLDVLWARGLEVTTDGSDRLKEEWDRLLAEFQARPITT